MPEADAVAMLATHRVGRLATADRAGVPSCVPVCFWYDGRDIFIALDEKPKQVEGRKLRRVLNILENPQVALLLDEYSESWDKLRYLMVKGRAHLSDPGDAVHAKAIEGLRTKYPQYRTMRIDEQPVIHIDPSRFTFWKGEGTLQ